MDIDREHVQQRFREYTAEYDAKDEKIALKISHTYRVAGLCERIAAAAGLDKAAGELAWLTGMLHDIGRFEQLRRYDTFNDAASVDHAQLGAEILFGKGGCIREFAADAAEDALIETAIRVHSAYRIPEGMDKRTQRFCNILRDADKIDILRVNVDTPLEEIYNTTRQELLHTEITPAVMESFQEQHATLRSLKKTPVDNIAGHISLIFELVFPESFRIVRQQGYWEKLLALPSENPVTRRQLGELRETMRQFLERKTQGLEQSENMEHERRNGKCL